MANQRAIYTIMLGDNPTFRLVRRNFERYAAAVGADLICCTEPRHLIPYLNPTPAPHLAAMLPWLEKFEIQRLLASYNRVLYLDADILIRPDAPDVFPSHADERHIYALNEGRLIRRNRVVEKTLRRLPGGFEWPETGGRKVYYNSGVMLFSREHAPLFELVKSDEVKQCFSLPMFEQSYFNYLFAKHGFSVHDLDCRFNWMQISGRRHRRLQAYFTHYAGGAFSRIFRRRNALMIDDYWTFGEDHTGERPPRGAWYYRARRFLYKIRFPIPLLPLNYC